MVFLANLKLQPAHGYAALLVVGAGVVAQYGAFKVVKARKTYGVEYPQMYAEKNDKNARAFNCVQRAHQNVLENLPLHFALVALSSVYRPEIAALAALVRTAGFLVYIEGYSTGDPKKRLRGAFGYIGFFSMIALSIEVGVRMILDV